MSILIFFLNFLVGSFGSTFSDSFATINLNDNYTDNTSHDASTLGGHESKIQDLVLPKVLVFVELSTGLWQQNGSMNVVQGLFKEDL